MGHAPRRGISFGLALVIALVVGRGSVAASCGDGVKGGLEVCDASAISGDAACPGACVGPGFADECTCVAPSLDADRYVVVADTQVRLGTATRVLSGHVGVGQGFGVLVVGRDGFTATGTQVVANRAKLLSGARVGRLFANEDVLSDGVVLANGGPFSFATPLHVLDGLPPFPTPLPGTLSIDVPASSLLVLPPGAYDAVRVGARASLILRGLIPGGGAGRYDIRSLRLGFEARLDAHNPVVVNVAERVSIAPSTRLGPAAQAPLAAGDVQLNVAGESVRIGHAAEVLAHIRAPRGVVRVARGSFVFGRVIGARVMTSRTSLVLEGACGDGRLDVTEQCDTSAPFGDLACPGACWAGDPGGQGRILIGLPGQCTCRCASSAECDDGDACNGAETCEAGICTLGIPLDCGDGNPCTRDCDPTVGCVSVPVEDGRGCSDRNPCTEGDQCQAGVCLAGSPRSCDDANPCTVDACDTTTGCLNVALPDATPCGTGRICVAGLCSS